MIAWIVAVLAFVPALLTLWNLTLYRRPSAAGGEAAGGISLVIPARNEASGIAACLASAQAAHGADLEIIVVDDGSTDATPAIVSDMAERDPRIRLVPAPPLPPGWSGKMHACQHGASLARHPTLAFIDADVRLAPGALAPMAALLRERGLGLASGFPRERAGTWGEILLIPLIHVLLLGYLPIARSRSSLAPGLAAGCGQLFVADAALYARAGGHGAARATWHDGVRLPRAFRRAGIPTDLFDATGLAECRMYAGFAATWRGLSKNATEGMATRAALPVWTVLLAGGHVLPFLLLPGLSLPAVAACCLLTAARIAVAVRFRQSPWSVVLWPAGMLVLLAVQWAALLRRSGGGTQLWRGRTQVSA